MYKGLSNDYHSKIIDQISPQNAVLDFGEWFLRASDGDFTSTDGLRLEDNFSAGENISIGECLSKTLTVQIYNDNMILRSAVFDRAKLYIGVQIGETEAQATGFTAYMEATDGNVFAAASDGFYVNNVKKSADIPISMIYEAGILTAYTREKAFVYDVAADAISDITPPNAFFTRKMTNNAICLEKITSAVTVDDVAYPQYLVNEWTTEDEYATCGHYEYCPCGVFLFDAPNRADDIIMTEAFDQMTRLDINFDNFKPSLPTTLGGLFLDLCAFAGVEAGSSTFPNSTLAISKNPFTKTGMTCREALSYIAEAAGCNAEFDRNGRLQLRFVAAGIVATIPRTQIKAQTEEISEYLVGRPTQIINRTEDGAVYSYGETDGNAYEIYANPFLSGSGLGIQFAALNGLPEYKTVGLELLELDPSIDCGDMVAVAVLSGADTIFYNAYGKILTDNDGNIFTAAEQIINVPLTSQSIRFAGLTSGAYNITGTAKRDLTGYARGGYSAEVANNPQGVVNVIQAATLQSPNYEPLTSGIKIDFLNGIINAPRFSVGDEYTTPDGTQQRVAHIDPFEFLYDKTEPEPLGTMYGVWEGDEAESYEIAITPKSTILRLSDYTQTPSLQKMIEIAATGITISDYVARKRATLTATGIITEDL